MHTADTGQATCKVPAGYFDTDQGTCWVPAVDMRGICIPLILVSVPAGYMHTIETLETLEI